MTDVIHRMIYGAVAASAGLLCTPTHAAAQEPSQPAAVTTRQSEEPTTPASAPAVVQPANTAPAAANSSLELLPEGTTPATAPAPVVSAPPIPQAAWIAPRVDVIGRAPRALDRVPGTASLVRREDLRQLAPQSSSDALRTVPGVHIVPEDGLGMRMNLGVRGLDPNRSRKILILEDGMPVTPNPYGSPEAYYSPPIERMERVEVVKGSGQILWGPQTIGGVLNFITKDPPRQPSANAELRYGAYNYLLAQAGVGATHGPIGWRVDVLHRRFDGPRRLDLAVTDVTGKLRMQLTPRSLLGLKLNFYDESSRATYLGLTVPQYTSDPTINLAENDRFLVRRYALGITHQQLFSDKLLLQTHIYAYETNRAWRRQEFDRRDLGVTYERSCNSSGLCGPPGAASVAPTQDGGSIFFRSSTAIRDRAFQVAGIEPRLTWNWSGPRIVSGELTALFRLHYERARTQLIVGSVPTAEAGDAQDDETRSGYAVAGAIQHRFSLWERLHITPGLRLESFNSSRQIVRVPKLIPSGVKMGTDTDIVGRAASYALIPGLGLSADLHEFLTLYSGAHRGYAPPRTQDAISPSGQNLELEPELSWNFELGARLRLGSVLNADIAAFHMEFENQIIPPSEAGGAVSGNSFNSGHSRHTGLEASVVFDAAALFKQQQFTLPLTVNYTYLPLATFASGLYSGNRLPYAPEQLLYLQLRFTHRAGLSAQVGMTYVSSQFADKENTPAQSLDGLLGQLPSYVVVDARVAYTLSRAGLTLYISGKNLTDQIYIASRAPSGIQPAGFRQVFGGLEWTWPAKSATQQSIR
jgi:Fe(3+) dicitrate transport protein